MASSDPQEELFAIRRERLADLIREHKGSSKKGHAALVKAMTKALDKHPEYVERIKSFMNASYISRALSGPLRKEDGKKVGARGGKNIGEEPAAAFEVLFGKPQGWMSSRDNQKATLPVSISRGLWESLTPSEKLRAEEQFIIYVQGLLSSREKAG